MKAKSTALPELNDVAAIAETTLKTIPEELRRHVGDVVIRIVEFADNETLTNMGMTNPFELLGLYQGVSLDQKSVSDPHPDVDMIFLYREPILDYARETGETLTKVVRHVLIHEIGHHFGFSDDDMKRIEEQA